MLPYSMIAGGTFTSTVGSGSEVICISQQPPDFYVMRNITQWGAAAAKDIEFWWEQSMAQGTAKGIHEAVTTGALNSFQLTADGITTYDTAHPPVFASLVAATAVTRGSANGVTVVTVTNDGVVGPIIEVGDVVRLTNVVGMQQISGFLFQVVAVTGTTSITIDLDSSHFAANGTSAIVTKVIPNRFYPKYAFPSFITQANPLVANVFRDTDFTVGEEVSFRIPRSENGLVTMSQLNNLKGVVASVTKATATTCTQVTVNIDTSGFSAFALQTSAQAAAAQFPTVTMIVPAGSGVVPHQSPPGTNLLDAYDNHNARVIHMGASMFANTTTGDVWQWQAFKYDEYNNQ
jgi:hypothetical protein